MTLYDVIVSRLFLVTKVLAADTDGSVSGGGGGSPASTSTTNGTSSLPSIKILPPTDYGTDIAAILNGLYKFGIWVFATITIIMTLYAAFQILTAGGDSKKVTAAWNTIKWAIMGFGLYLIAGGLVSVIKEVLL